jgi:colanic acid biosynthesis glycosyl transferase WcaI
MSRRILLVSDSYPPEIRSASHLIYELAVGLRDRGHEVFVVTSRPGYNLDEKDRRTKSWPRVAIEEGITVLRVPALPHHLVNYVARGISQLLMPWQFFASVRRNVKGPIDAVIVYSPPLPLSIVGKLVKRWCGARYLLNLQDIFPRNAVELGVLRSRLLIRFFERMEKGAYASADVVTVHSAGHLALLEKKGVGEGRLKVLHNWVDVGQYRIPAADPARYRREWGLEGRFVLLYAGVMGPSQGLDLVVRAAAEVKDLADLRFLLVGDGSGKEGLERLAAELGCTNVLFRPFVSRTDYPFLAREADAGLVSLSSRNRTPVVPGKILGYMAAGIPVLALLNRESDAHEIIREAGCGLSAASDRLDQVVAAIREMYSARALLAGWGENGLRYVSAHFEREVCVGRLQQLIGIGRKDG